MALGKQEFGGEILGDAGKAVPLEAGGSVLGLDVGSKAGLVGTNRIGKCWSSAPALPPSLYLELFAPGLSGEPSEYRHV